MNRYVRWLLFIIAGVLMMNLAGLGWAASEPFIIDLLRGEPVPFAMMLDDLSRTRIVYLGEVHTIPRHHQIQTAILEGLAERTPKVAVGMEMFAQAQQPILDRWLQGREDVSALIRELGHERWGNLKDYEAVLLAARRLPAPIIGLNASDKLVRDVARHGLEGLSAENQKLVPEGLDRMTNPLNDRLLRLRLRVHKAFQHGSLDRIVLAQTLRDVTMAAGVADFLNSPRGKDHLMLVIAGNGHVNYGFGIPERVRARLDVPHRIVLASESGELVLSEEEERQSVPIDITHEDLSFIRVPIGDYLNVIPLPPEEQSSPADEVCAPRGVRTTSRAGEEQP
jgi:uncharacterized iron-regulated protein